MVTMADDKGQAERFVRAGRARRGGLVLEFWDFLKHNKKWWLLPILLVFLLMGLLVVLSGSGVGAWMYTVF
jgi:hypothetical protein